MAIITTNNFNAKLVKLTTIFYEFLSHLRGYRWIELKNFWYNRSRNSDKIDESSNEHRVVDDVSIIFDGNN